MSVVWCKRLIFLSFLPIYIGAATIGSNTVVSRQGLATFPAADTNIMLGFAFFESGFTLENNLTTCTFSDVFPVGGPISLNGGSLYLNNDLNLAGGVSMVTPGIITTSTTIHPPIVFPADDELLAFPTESRLLNVVTNANVGAAVNAVSWSYDGIYLAEGSNTSGAGGEINVYYFTDPTLTLTRSVEVGQNVYAVAWHPNSYYLAVGKNVSGGALPAEIYIYKLDVPAGTFVFTFSVEVNQNVNAIAWHPSGNQIVFGENVKANELVLYDFSTVTGGLSNRRPYNINPDRLISRKGLDWDSTGSYLAVGVAGSINPELLLYYFDGSVLTATLSLASTGITINSVEWSPNESYIAAGFNSGTQNVKIYKHTVADGTLTQVGTAVTGITDAVFKIDWNSSNYVAIGKAGTYDVLVYQFDPTAKTLSFIAQRPLTGSANAVEWSPNKQYIASGDAGNFVTVYKFLSSGGILQLENAIMVFNSPTQINCPVLFKGLCLFIGSDNVVDIASTSSFVVDAGATVYFRDITLKSIRDGSIRCNASSSSVVFDNAQLWLDENFSFTQGSLLIQNDVQIIGSKIFTYQSSQTSTIATKSMLLLDEGMTFSYAPPSTSKNLMLMTDTSSTLYLNTVNLYSTTTGLQLTKGKLVVEGECKVYSAATVQAEGIMFGDGISATNDLNLEILPESGLNVMSGYLIYNNITS